MKRCNFLGCQILYSNRNHKIDQHSTISKDLSLLTKTDFNSIGCFFLFVCFSPSFPKTPDPCHVYGVVVFSDGCWHFSSVLQLQQRGRGRLHQNSLLWPSVLWFRVGGVDSVSSINSSIPVHLNSWTDLTSDQSCGVSSASHSLKQPQPSAVLMHFWFLYAWFYIITLLTVSLTPRSIKLMDNANKILVLRHNALPVCVLLFVQMFGQSQMCCMLLRDRIVVRNKHAGLKAKECEVNVFKATYPHIDMHILCYYIICMSYMAQHTPEFKDCAWQLKSLSTKNKSISLHE